MASKTLSLLPTLIQEPLRHFTNPFSPPGSVYNVDTNAPSTPAAHAQTYSFLDSASPARNGITSVSTSVADLSRVSSSYFGSRPGTSDYGVSGRPSSARLRESFASPKPRPLTMYTSAQPSTVKIQRERLKSTMITSLESIEKPWISSRDPYARIAYFVTYTVVLLGIALGAIRCFFGWRDVALMSGNLCMVMEENFDSEDGVFGDNGKFFREVDMSGFGNGEFEMTTGSENNSFIQNGNLYIMPTLTTDNIGNDAILDGSIFNITGVSSIGQDQDFDAAGYYKACSAVSNATAGTIINPVQSARLTTRRSASIKYGRVEVRAKIPTGDWLWPAIWMLPVDSSYGAWPASGEIDIMEARGNGPSYPKQGSNFVRGSLNWGPNQFLNAVFKTFGWWEMRRGAWNEQFHTYALEWDEDFMRIYVDTRLHHLLDLRINMPFWQRGDFPGVIQNGSQAVILENPWVNGTKQPPSINSFSNLMLGLAFYLILNVAVGGTNGWFPDGNEKPWLDASSTAMSDFWRNRDKWLPSWPSSIEDRAMVVDYVKMWQKC
ncbi:concanavalin A-like lectin/glucanase domain-containing protein [Cyathus striatus]|nr:concanavalin A-like lectin/glucanase domain-containing protein [Cyathus striatus]